MFFQVANSRGRNFLDLLDNNLNSIISLNIKGSSWLQYFSLLNSLCAKATRAIINHTPISKYWLRFFPREDFLYPYSMYPIKIRRYILYKYSRFNKYWNSKRDTIAYFTLFL